MDEVVSKKITANDCVLDGIVVLLLIISYESKVTDMRYIAIDST